MNKEFNRTALILKKQGTPQYKRLKFAFKGEQCYLGDKKAKGEALKRF